MVYVFDIDGTICHTHKSAYEDALPIEERIKVINKLYDDGDTIYFLTARGMGRTNNSQNRAIELLHDFTEKQLISWGVKFHRLFLGKPAADLYVDDKGIKDADFFILKGDCDE